MIEELKTAFAPHELMLTAAVSAGKTTIGFIMHFFSLLIPMKYTFLVLLCNCRYGIWCSSNE